MAQGENMKRTKKISHHNLHKSQQFVAINIKSINNNWTLFLDRDGVINHEKENDYIHTWDEFVFYEGAKEAMKFFARKFKYIFIITNQRGVGKGVTTSEDLNTIHQNMIKEIEMAGGRINKIYFCTDLDDNSPNRKPQPGMALQAKQDFPDIDFNQSVMVGNTLSDMEFGRNIGATTVFLPTTKPDVSHTENSIDAVYKSLADFAAALQSVR
jgi:D-glycero-D-manno-heptose 1,7-bisphosphate phosphatase